MRTTNTKTTSKKAATKATPTKRATKATATGRAAKTVTSKSVSAKTTDANRAVKRFRAPLETVEGMEPLLITIPFDVQKVFGTRARVPVRGTVNGFPFRSSIFPRGDGRHYMAINRQMREGGRLKGGETASFTMERDEEARLITPPEDLARALKSNEDAQAAWDKLSYTHRKEYAQAVEGAKKPETRQRRIEKTLAELAARRKASASKERRES